MTISRFSIHHFRNISDVDLIFSPRFNLIFGDNGSGKTSLLEAIYYLAHNRSFRSHLKQRIIQHDKDKFTLFAEVFDDKIGLEKSSKQRSQLRLNEEALQNISTITKKLPIQLIDAKSFQLLDAGPEYRRQFLDWGVFHVEHQYLSVWKKFQRVLKQRNQALRQKLPLSEIQLWDERFVVYAEAMTDLREAYFTEFLEYFNKNCHEMNVMKGLTCTYSSGWEKEASLSECLDKNNARDLKLGFTHAGPHRADIKIQMKNVAVKDVLSRGQQKLLVFMLKTAQLEYFYQKTGKRPLFLVDDLGSELDNTRRGIIIDKLNQLQAQIFVTGITKDIFAGVSQEGSSMFHVEHGRVST
jgi:DNA replication and repair protein RecF